MNMPRPHYPGWEDRWIGFNVDILMKSGRKYCNVPFRNVRTTVNPNNGNVEYLWVIDDYSSYPPRQMELDANEVSEISQAPSSICRTTMPPMPPTNSQTWPSLPPNCYRQYNPYTGQFDIVCY